MRKSDLIKKISQTTGVNASKTSSILQSFIDVIGKSLKEGKDVSLYNFGRFKSVVRSERKFYNCSTQAIELLPKRKTVKFIPYRQLKLTTNKAICPSQTIAKGRINTGRRRTGDTTEFHENEFKYVGTVEYDRFLGEHDHTAFPAVKTPMNGTKILSWYKSHKDAVVGVTEPLLLAEVEKLCNKYDGLTLLDKIALPIKNRQYSYRPDIALQWEKYGIYIDIEIDEPYDICEHKPLHYIGCSDNLRDSYFTRNGWCVIRYSENQILNHLTETIEHIEFTINWLLEESAKHYTLVDEKRWSYEEAAEMAKDSLRESEFGIDRQERNTDAGTRPYNVFINNFVKPDFDILPNLEECSHDSLIDSQLDYALASSMDYIRLTDIDGRECILEKGSIQKKAEDGQMVITGYNPIIPFLKNYPFKHTAKVEAISSFFTDDHWESLEDTSNRGILVKAASNGSPIWIRYRNSQGEESERYISNLCLFMTQIEASAPFTDLGAIANFEKDWGFYLFGFCSMRQEFRQFAADHRLSEVKIVNCEHAFIYPEAYQGSLADLIMNPYNYQRFFFNRVDYLLSIMPAKERSSLLSKGNIAHYEVIRGNLERALEMYLNTPFNADMNIKAENPFLWGKTCIEDINSFIEAGLQHKDSNYDFDIVPSKMVENFTKIKEMLIEQGWRWE